MCELCNDKDLEINENIYFDVVNGKTASLFSAACQIGGISAKGNKNEINAIKSFGKNFGMTFQLIDDVFDYSSCENELGKNIGNDLSQGNATLPLLYAMWNGDKNQAGVIHDSIINGDLKNIELIKDAINSTGAISYTAKIAYQESERAINALNQLPSSKYLDALYALAKFSVQRHN